MKAIKLLFLIPVLLFSIVACQKEDATFVEKSDPTGRVTVRNVPIRVVPQAGLKTVPAEPLGFDFSLIAEVDAPMIGDAVLQATEVKLNANYAAVSYNMKGAGLLGALEIMDVANPFIPAILKTFLFPDADINTVEWLEDYIVIGGQDIDGAFYALVDPDGAISQVIERKRLTGHSTINILTLGDEILMVTGDNGGITWINAVTGNQEGFESFVDARSIDVVGMNRGVLLTSTFLHLVDELNTQSLPLDPNWIQPQSKADVEADDDFIYAALNRGGVKIYNHNLVEVDYIDRPVTPAGLNPEDFVSNSVSANQGLLFTANGGAGILVSRFTENPSDLFVEYGYFDFGGSFSSNYVKSQGNFIFVATGLGGLKILSFEEREPFVCENWSGETAFAGSMQGEGSAWWYIFETGATLMESVTHPIFAGQRRVPGASVTYWNNVLTIDLGPFMRLKEGSETVKIQGYNTGQLPNRRPPAGQFTTYKGESLVVEVGHFDYFVIHLDVEVCQDETPTSK